MYIWIFSLNELNGPSDRFLEWNKNQNPHVIFLWFRKFWIHRQKAKTQRESRMTVLNSDQVKFKRKIKYMKGLYFYINYRYKHYYKTNEGDLSNIYLREDK